MGASGGHKLETTNNSWPLFDLLNYGEPLLSQIIKSHTGVGSLCKSSLCDRDLDICIPVLHPIRPTLREYNSAFSPGGTQQWFMSCQAPKIRYFTMFHFSSLHLLVVLVIIIWLLLLFRVLYYGAFISEHNELIASAERRVPGGTNVKRPKQV